MTNPVSLSYDLEMVEIPVKIGKEDYILREASESAVCKYRNALLKATKLGPDGKLASIDGMADVEPLLVSLCLYEKYDHKGEKKERLVNIQKILAWKSSIVKDLFANCKKISEIDDDETAESLNKQMEELKEKMEKLKEKEDKVKNESEPTADTAA